MEARSLNAARMLEMEPQKRYTLAAALIRRQIAQRLDDIGEMLIKKMRKMHRQAHEEFQQTFLRRQSQTDQLMMILFQVLSIWLDESPADRKQTALGLLLDHQAESVMALCRIHQSLTKNDHFGFLWKHFRGHRAVLFSIIEELRFIAPGRDKSLERAIDFLKPRRPKQEEWLKIDPGEEKIDLGWIPDRWWKQTTGREKRAADVDKVDRLYFEMCVCTSIAERLQSGDLVIEASNKFSDYRDQFISDAEFDKAAPEYCRQAGLPAKNSDFVDHPQRSNFYVADFPPQRHS